MIVLGLHGSAGTHDAAAALIVDGVVVSCVEEERLNRRKHAISDVPRLAALSVLHSAGLEPEDVDTVAYGWHLPTYLATHGNQWDFDDADLFRRVLGRVPRRLPRLEWVRHHDAHAASTYFSSGFAESAVLVVDGQGEDRSISLYDGRGGDIRLLRDWLPSRSLGFLYEAATLHCGFGFLDAGKTMGLAAHGIPPAAPLPLEWVDDDICSPIRDDVEEEAVTAAWRRLLADRFGAPAAPECRFDPFGSTLRWADESVAPHQPDVAAAAQDAMERCMRGLVRYAQRETGSRQVALAGGVALNCVANGLLLADCERLFIPPAAHDAGVALGAAMLVAARAGDNVVPPRGAGLGPSYAPDLVASIVDRARLRARRVDDPAAEAARRLTAGQVIGWFQGGAEVGPRALGHRSILAAPYPAANKDRVNSIKGREPWRPLAPSLLREETARLLGATVDSPYMLVSLPLSEEGLRMIPAVSHVDGSTRVQTVARDAEEPYARLLAHLGEATGTSVVLNTSFNAPGEPIVCSPGDAIRTYSTMGLDALVMEDLVLSKDGA